MGNKILAHPHVLDCAVASLQLGDGSTRQVAKAFVVRMPGSKVCAQDIHECVRGECSRCHTYMLLLNTISSSLASAKEEYERLDGGLAFVESIPRNQAGKIVRDALRQIGN